MWDAKRVYQLFRIFYAALWDRFLVSRILHPKLSHGRSGNYAWGKGIFSCDRDKIIVRENNWIIILWVPFFFLRLVCFPHLVDVLQIVCSQLNTKIHETRSMCRSFSCYFVKQISCVSFLVCFPVEVVNLRNNKGNWSNYFKIIVRENNTSYEMCVGNSHPYICFLWDSDDTCSLLFCMSSTAGLMIFTQITPAKNLKMKYVGCSKSKFPYAVKKIKKIL